MGDPCSAVRAGVRNKINAMRWLLVIAAAAAAAAAAAPTKEQYRVLILGPLGSRSLHHLCSALAEALGDAGHEVTHVTSFKIKSHHSRHGRVREVHTGADNRGMEEVNMFQVQDITAVLEYFTEPITVIGDAMWTNEEIKQLWRERNTFDAIVIIAYGNEVALPFLLDYGGVFINLCTPGIEFNIISYQGNFLPFSTVPAIMSHYTMEMNFFERTVNVIIHFFIIIMYNYIIGPHSRGILEKHFPEMPDIHELYTSSSLTLINGHFSIDGQVPLLPSQVEIGTINAKRPQPLPQDLEEFVDAAREDGVILFSLGSAARSAHIKKKYKDIFVAAFRRLPQRVVWKYEGDDLQMPPNVMTKAWLPQQDLLGHNTTRLFISHCGNLGLQEAQYHGVPILALPLTLDQPRNAHRIAKNGYGLVLRWDELSVEVLLEAIDTLLHTPQYRDKVQAVSRALQDQKESPAERATWWVEYAIRHKGSPHMVYAGKRLNYLQYIMIDVAAFWLTVMTSWFVLSLYCLRRVIRWCRKPRGENLQDKKYL